MGLSSSTIWVGIHAVALLALPACILVFLAISQKRVPPARSVIGWTALCSVMLFPSIPCLCMEASPYFQILIPVVCFWLTALLVKDKNKRYPVVVVCAIVYLILWQQYDFWATGREWTSAPGRTANTEKLRHKRAIEEAENALLEAAKSNDRTYAAMWYSELPCEKNVRANEPLELRHCKPRSEWVACWHTRITGLFLRNVLSEQDYWYMGGPLSEATGKIVIKDRPVASASD